MESMDWLNGEYGLVKWRVWTGQSESLDWVKREYGLGKGRIWTG